MLYRQTIPLDKRNFIISPSFFHTFSKISQDSKTSSLPLDENFYLRHSALLSSTSRVDSDIMEDILYRYLASSTEKENLISSLGFYGFSFSQNKFVMHLFLPGEVNISLSDIPVRLHISTDYPNGNEIITEVFCHTHILFVFAVRIPSWCKNCLFYVNDKLAECKVKNGYVYLKRVWKNEDLIKIILYIPSQGLPFLS